jgi:hypothetical protein
MQTYSVQFEFLGIGVTWKRKVLAVLIFGIILFLFMWVCSVLTPARFGLHRGLLSIAFQAGWTSLIYGSLMAFVPGISRRGRAVIEISVENDSISSRIRPGGMRRTVRRGKIRSIFEIKGRLGGIGISERSEFGARMLGYVHVPASLPEYEELKRLAESWRVVE